MRNNAAAAATTTTLAVGHGSRGRGALQSAGGGVEFLLSSPLLFQPFHGLGVPFAIFLGLFFHPFHLGLQINNPALGLFPAIGSAPHLFLGLGQTALQGGLLGLQDGDVPLHLVRPLDRALQLLDGFLRRMQRGLKAANLGFGVADGGVEVLQLVKKRAILLDGKRVLGLEGGILSLDLLEAGVELGAVLFGRGHIGLMAS